MTIRTKTCFVMTRKEKGKENMMQKACAAAGFESVF